MSQDEPANEPATGFLAVLREFKRQVDAAPPAVSRLYATHKVPYGRVFRMWTARGEMIAYANRGEIADMPRAKASSASTICPPSITGIPVVFE